jgi:hypothetical protein
MKLRIFWGFVLGTVLNLIAFSVFATANGTPVPSWRSLRAMLAYPTGSIAATLAFAWLLYFLCLIPFLAFPPRKPER